MKAKQITHIEGLSGIEEVLALQTLQHEVEEANKLDDFFSINWENKHRGMSLQEAEALDDTAESAGFGSGCVANHETYF
jgi:hypothetical protein